MNTRLIVSAVLLLCACGHLEEVNTNNGIGKVLSFDPLPTLSPLGGSFKLDVSHQNAGTYECAPGRIEVVPRLQNVPGDCRFAGTPVSVRWVMSADDCGGACTTTIATNSRSVIVTPLVAGSAVLKVVAMMTDGTTSEDSIALNFAKFEPLSIKCLEPFKCPGPHAVFVGATIDWEVRAMASATAQSLYSKFEVTESGGVVSIEIVREKVRITALKPGVATIQFRDRTQGRDYVTTRQLRVVDVSEAILGEARLRAGAADADGLHRADADLVGAEVPAFIDTEAPQLILTWLLADGSRALGGAGRVKSATGQVVVPTRELELDEAEVDHAIFYFNAAPGPVELTASLGSAQLRLRYSYTYEAPALPTCPALSRYATDLTEQNGDVPAHYSWVVKVSVDQWVGFDFRYAPSDIVVEQVCGPVRMLVGPQSTNFSIHFPVPGIYQFGMRNRAGEHFKAPNEIEVVR